MGAQQSSLLRSNVPLANARGRAGAAPPLQSYHIGFIRLIASASPTQARGVDKTNDRSNLFLVSKGEETRQAILSRAFELATVVGLSGLSIGRLAEATGLSKSGLFAHFGSKEALEVAVVEEASRQFVQEVMVPALREPRGEPRLRALVERWIAWSQRPGGCFFAGASTELDDRPGPPRDALVRAIKDWVDELAKAVRIGIREGHFRPDVDPDQVAFEIYGIVLGMHTFHRFLREPTTLDRARKAFERLLDASRVAPPRPR
jgi:AcrR family transcriptional regulator